MGNDFPLNTLTLYPSKVLDFFVFFVGKNSNNFKPKFQRDARAGQVKVLLAQGWTRMGGYWLSPYSNIRFSERVAIDVEILRGTFLRVWQRSARQKIKARRAAAD